MNWSIDIRLNKEKWCMNGSFAVLSRLPLLDFPYDYGDGGGKVELYGRDARQLQSWLNLLPGSPHPSQSLSLSDSICYCKWMSCWLQNLEATSFTSVVSKGPQSKMALFKPAAPFVKRMNERTSRNKRGAARKPIEFTTQLSLRSTAQVNLKPPKPTLTNILQNWQFAKQLTIVQL